MKQEVKIDQADYTVFILVRDTSGNAKTALVFGDIDLAYARVETDNDVTTTDVAPATLASLTAAHDDWGFLLVSDTDHPGLYRLDIADEVFATGAWSAVVTLTGAGLEPSHLEFVMVPELPYSANGSSLTEAGGDGDHLTAINLPDQTMNIVGNITGNLSGTVGSVTGAVGSVTGSVGSVVGNVGGNVVGTVASVVGAVGSVTGAVGSVTGAVGSVTGNVGGLVVGTVAGVTPAAVGAAMTLTAGAVDAILDEAAISRR